MRGKIASDSLITTPNHSRQGLPSATSREVVSMVTQKQNYFSATSQQRDQDYKLCQEAGVILLDREESVPNNIYV